MVNRMDFLDLKEKLAKHEIDIGQICSEMNSCFDYMGASMKSNSEEQCATLLSKTHNAIRRTLGIMIAEINPSTNIIIYLDTYVNDNFNKLISFTSSAEKELIAQKKLTIDQLFAKDHRRKEETREYIMDIFRSQLFNFIEDLFFNSLKQSYINLKKANLPSTICPLRIPFPISFPFLLPMSP